LGLLGIYFCQSELWFQLGSSLGKSWGHHFAGTTPGCPEIHQHRYVIAAYGFLKIAFAQFHGMRRKKWLMAFSAAGIICQPGTGDAIYCRAVRAYEMY